MRLAERSGYLVAGDLASAARFADVFNSGCPGCWLPLRQASSCASRSSASGAIESRSTVASASLSRHCGGLHDERAQVRTCCVKASKRPVYDCAPMSTIVHSRATATPVLVLRSHVARDRRWIGALRAGHPDAALGAALRHCLLRRGHPARRCFDAACSACSVVVLVREQTTIACYPGNEAGVSNGGAFSITSSSPTKESIVRILCIRVAMGSSRKAFGRARAGARGGRARIRAAVRAWVRSPISSMDRGARGSRPLPLYGAEPDWDVARRLPAALRRAQPHLGEAAYRTGMAPLGGYAGKIRHCPC